MVFLRSRTSYRLDGLSYLESFITLISPLYDIIAASQPLTFSFTITLTQLNSDSWKPQTSSVCSFSPSA